MWNDMPLPESVVLLTNYQEMAQDIVDAQEREFNNLIGNNVF